MGRIALDAEEKESHPSFWAGAAPHSHRCLNGRDGYALGKPTTGSSKGSARRIVVTMRRPGAGSNGRASTTAGSEQAPGSDPPGSLGLGLVQPEDCVCVV